MVFKKAFLILLCVLSLHFWAAFFLILMLFFHTLYLVLISVCSLWSTLGLVRGHTVWHAFIIVSASLLLIPFFLRIRYDIWPQSSSFQILWEASFSQLLGGMAQDGISSFILFLLGLFLGSSSNMVLAFWDLLASSHKPVLFLCLHCHYPAQFDLLPSWPLSWRWADHFWKFTDCFDLFQVYWILRSFTCF